MEIEISACDKRTNDVYTEYEDTYTDNEHRKYLTELSKLYLKGSLALLRVSKSVCDLAHFGVHSRCADNGFAASVNDG